MNRKLLNFILSGTLLISGMSMLSSCKDTSEDQFAEINSEVVAMDATLKDHLLKAEQTAQNLQTAIDNLRADLQRQIDAIKSCDCPDPSTLATLAQLQALDNRLQAVEALLSECNLSENKDLLANLPDTLDGLADRILALEQAGTQAGVTLEDVFNDPRMADVWKLVELSDVQALQEFLNNFEVKTLPGALKEMLKQIQELKNLEIPADLTEEVLALQGDVSGLITRIGDVEEALGLKANQEDLNNLAGDVEALKTRLDQEIATINTTIENKYTELQNYADTLMEAVKTELKAEIAALEGKVNTNTADIEALKGSVAALQQKLEEIVSCSCDLTEINAKLAELDRVKASVEDLKSLETRLNKIINSIVIQQVTNNVFGSLSLPLGIETNVLMAYHGTNGSHITTFPSSKSSYEYDNEQRLSSAELAGTQTIDINSILLDEAENNAGNVYFTVNPSNVDLTGSVFSLVNSLDNGSGIELSTPVPCDKLLMFGWSRANNGFYCSNARLSEANIAKCNIELAGDLKHEIKVAAKNFLHDLKHQDRPDISQIASVIKDVLQSLNGQLPANAIKGMYRYNDLNGNEQVAAAYSNYGIAAVTFEPLSFKFLEGQDNKWEINEISPIESFEFDMGKVQINFGTGIDVNGIDVRIEIGTIEFGTDDIKVEGYVKIPVVDANGQPVLDENGQPIEQEYPLDIQAVDLSAVAQKINDTLKEVELQVNQDVIDQVNDMVKEINQQVEDMLKKMEAQVNDQLNDLLEDLSSDINGQVDKYINKINKIINRVNRLIARVNRVLAHPNKYLQPLAIYNGSDGELHILSTSRVKPSKFQIAGGNATTLYFTSYTLEAIAPAYKKFVKVVNAWKNGDASRVNVPAVVDKVNGKGSLNQVINGNQIRFAFAPEAGYTYEIVFQALDYQGYTSTRRCFIEVR